MAWDCCQPIFWRRVGAGNCSWKPRVALGSPAWRVSDAPVTVPLAGGNWEGVLEGGRGEGDCVERYERRMQSCGHSAPSDRDARQRSPGSADGVATMLSIQTWPILAPASRDPP